VDAQTDDAAYRNYTTTAQTGLNGRTVPFNRGFGLGGSSLTSKSLAPIGHKVSNTQQIDYMVYNRGSMDDWNNYARLAGGDKSLTWNNIYPLTAKHENFTFPVTTRDLVSSMSAHQRAGPDRNADERV
jgi:hypothetical protein